MENKYQLGQKVFFIGNGKIEEGVILDIGLEDSKVDAQRIVYGVVVVVRSLSARQTRYEDELFLTKEDLIKSL